MRAQAPAADREPAADPEQEQDGQRLEVYGDSAYGSGQARADYQAAGHDTVIKPGPVRPAVPGGFTIDDFTVNEDDGTVTCPAGQVRPMSGKRAVTFGPVCAACPLRELCTTAKDGRSMTIHPHDRLLRAARLVQRRPSRSPASPPERAHPGFEGRSKDGQNHDVLRIARALTGNYLVG